MRAGCFRVASPDHADGSNDDQVRFAVWNWWPRAELIIADGAGSTMHSGKWAEALIKAPWQAIVDAKSDDAVASATAAWLANARKRYGKPTDHLHPAARTAPDWYYDEFDDKGAMSTFVGCSIRRIRYSREYTLRAVGIGDSALIVVRGKRVFTTFPVAPDHAFTTRTSLLGSVAGAQPEAIATFSTRIRRGDIVIVATDAVAAWLLATDTANRAVRLITCADENEFRTLVTEAQSNQDMAIDDATVGFVVV